VTTEGSEPEPDLALVQGPARRYAERHPSASDTALVVEVSDTSLERDREVKGPIYASAGFPAYWIINLVDHRLEVFTDPSGPVETPGYATRTDRHPGEDVQVVVEGREIRRIPVADLFVV
jgi:Uma2 family endonuclease